MVFLHGRVESLSVLKEPRDDAVLWCKLTPGVLRLEERVAQCQLVQEGAGASLEPLCEELAGLGLATAPNLRPLQVEGSARHGTALQSTALQCTAAAILLFQMEAVHRGGYLESGSSAWRPGRGGQSGGRSWVVACHSGGMGDGMCTLVLGCPGMRKCGGIRYYELCEGNKG